MKGRNIAVEIKQRLHRDLEEIAHLIAEMVEENPAAFEALSDYGTAWGMLEDHSLAPDDRKMWDEVREGLVCELKRHAQRFVVEKQ